MKSLNQYKENYLLIGAVILYCAFFIIYFSFFSIEEINNSPSRLGNVTNFKVFILLALILAPVLEEFIFRGYFTKNRKQKLVTIIGLPIFVFLTGKQYLIFLILPYIIILIIDFFKIYKVHKHIVFITSAFLFSIVHYKLSDLDNVITALPMLAQFSMGLLLIWIVLNFNLKTSIFVHFLHNLIVILPLFIYIQFPNTESKSIKLNEYKITWKKMPVFNKKNLTVSKPNSYKVDAINVTPLRLYGIYNSSSKTNLKDSELFSNYEISIEKLNNSAKELDSVIVKSLLIKAELIIELDEN